MQKWQFAPHSKAFGNAAGPTTNFDKHIQGKKNKCYKMVDIIKWLSVNFPYDAF